VPHSSPHAPSGGPRRALTGAAVHAFSLWPPRATREPCGPGRIRARALSPALQSVRSASDGTARPDRPGELCVSIDGPPSAAPPDTGGTRAAGRRRQQGRHLSMGIRATHPLARVVAAGRATFVLCLGAIERTTGNPALIEISDLMPCSERPPFGRLARPHWRQSTHGTPLLLRLL